MAQKKKPNEPKTASKSSQKLATAGTGKNGNGQKVTEVERELALQGEYQTLSEHLVMLRTRVRNFERDNDFLDQEAKRIQEENKVFATYMAKRAQKMDASIIRLSDYNQQMLQGIQGERAEVLAHFKEKESELRSQLLERQMRFSATCKEVEELQPFRELQAEQNSRIKELELEVLSMWVMHADNVQRVKSRFMQDKSTSEKESRHKIQLLIRRAARAASCSLAQRIVQVRKENCQLRCEILKLIRQAQILKLHRSRLREQNLVLREELDYDRELVRILRVRHRPPGERDGEEGEQERRPDLSQIWQYLYQFRAEEAEMKAGEAPSYKHYEKLAGFLQALISDFSLLGDPPAKSSLSICHSNRTQPKTDQEPSSSTLTMAMSTSRTEP
ncbi:coiled-coil domain-containing protein 166 isoform X1 [Rhinatrema bivittatum]|uniref:coiled-coil domain-containing protein 166 isoform X1 n=1 Tax=Rhinatrema bivittatum TaxID=194408 RepID=UPI00112BF7CB|nr:coiled-coil domain-containing protein 166 isoform X1 [Rhinatrema bivittatum]